MVFWFSDREKKWVVVGMPYWVGYWDDGIILPVIDTGNNGMVVFTSTTSKFWLVVYQ